MLEDSIPQGNYRARLAWVVEDTVNREGHRMGVPPMPLTRAKEALILRMLARFRTEQEFGGFKSLYPYLRKCARRELARAVKKEAKAPPIEFIPDLDVRAPTSREDDPAKIAAERHEVIHLTAKIATGLEEIAPRQRQILELRLKGYRDKTIAAILDTTGNAVHVMAWEAIKRLRSIYRDPS